MRDPDRRGRDRPRARVRLHRTPGTVEFIVDEDGSLLLPGDEHPAPGRAHRDRDGDRARPRRAADPVARGEAVDVDRAARPSIQCRINAEDPAATSSRVRAASRATRSRRGPSFASTPASRPAETSRRLRLDVREGHRPGRGPRAGAAADAGGAVRVPGRGRADDDPPAPLGAGVTGVPRRRHTTTWLERALAEVDLPRRSSSTPPAAAKPAPRPTSCRGRRPPCPGPDLRRAAGTGAGSPGPARPPPGEHVHGVHHGADAGHDPEGTGGEGSGDPGRATCSASSRP